MAALHINSHNMTRRGREPGEGWALHTAGCWPAAGQTHSHTQGLPLLRFRFIADIIHIGQLMSSSIIFKSVRFLGGVLLEALFPRIYLQ